MVEPVVENRRRLEAEMEKLRLVRERRAQQAAERIAKEGFDRFAPPGSANGLPSQSLDSPWEQTRGPIASTQP